MPYCRLKDFYQRYFCRLFKGREWSMEKVFPSRWRAPWYWIRRGAIYYCIYYMWIR